MIDKLLRITSASYESQLMLRNVENVQLVQKLKLALKLWGFAIDNVFYYPLNQ